MTSDQFMRAQFIQDAIGVMTTHIRTMEQFNCCTGSKSRIDPLGTQSALPVEMIEEFRNHAIAHLKSERAALVLEMEAI